MAAALEAVRERRGALAVESVEPEFAFDRAGHVTEVLRGEQTESHRLIEHLMIAANEQVATLLEQRGVPALYRVHERPDPARVERLAAQLGVARRPDAAAARAPVPAAGRRRRRRDEPHWSTSTCAAPAAGATA